MYNHDIENWWRHLGCYDRQQASGIAYLGDTSTFLFETDNWWDGLDGQTRQQVYDNFFDES